MTLKRNKNGKCLHHSQDGNPTPDQGQKIPASTQSCRHWVRRLGIYRPGQSKQAVKPAQTDPALKEHVCVVKMKRGLGTASVHCPLSGDYMLVYYFNQVVTVSFPLIL